VGGHVDLARGELFHIDRVGHRLSVGLPFDEPRNFRPAFGNGHFAPVLDEEIDGCGLVDGDGVPGAGLVALAARHGYERQPGEPDRNRGDRECAVDDPVFRFEFQRALFRAAGEFGNLHFGRADRRRERAACRRSEHPKCVHLIAPSV